MGCVAAQCKHAGIEDGIAAIAVAFAPAEGPGKRLLILAPEFRPLMDGPITAVDLWCDREVAAGSAANEQLEHTGVLHPAVGVDPKINVMTREMPRQVGPGGEYLE